MRKVSSTDLIRRILLVTALALCQGGCGKRQSDPVSMGDWISLLISEAGITHSSTEMPYYLNVPPSSVYFEDIQTAVDWEILSADIPVDPASPLTREWAACTLMKLAGITNENETLRIRDLNRTQFPEEVRSAVISGLMKLDKKERFHPEQEVDAEEGKQLLKKVLEHMDRKHFENDSFLVQWQEEEPVLLEYETYDEENGEMTFAAGTALQAGQLYYTDQEDLKLWKADEVYEDEEWIHAVPQPADPLEHISSLQMQGSFEADFSTAEITDLNGKDIIQEAYSFTENTAFRLMAFHEKKKVKEIGGFTVSYETSRDGISIQASKTSAGGMNIYAGLELNGVGVDYKWDIQNKEVKEAYLRICCTAGERLGAERSAGWQKQVNPAGLSKENFLQTVRSALKDGQSDEVLSLPVCRIRFPIPEVPGAAVYCELNLDVSASGRAEISFGQSAVFGMEVRNGSVRPVSSFTNTPKAMIEASTSVLSEIGFALKAAGCRLSDIVIHAGLDSTVISTVHQYDKNGGHTSAVTDLPADLVNEMSSADDGILVCSDIKAGWVSDIDINSTDSACGKLGLSMNIPLLKDAQANVFPKTHMENFHFVDRCTRTDREKNLPYEELPESEQISLSVYSMIMDPGETGTLQVTHIPAGYDASSLRTASQDPSVAAVSGLNIKAVSEGSTVVTVSTSDGKYSIRCTVSVRQEKGNAGRDH